MYHFYLAIISFNVLVALFCVGAMISTLYFTKSNHKLAFFSLYLFVGTFNAYNALSMYYTKL